MEQLKVFVVGSFVLLTTDFRWCEAMTACFNRSLAENSANVKQHIVKMQVNDPVELLCTSFKNAADKSELHQSSTFTTAGDLNSTFWFAPSFEDRYHWDATDIEYSEQFNRTLWLTKLSFLDNATFFMRRFRQEDTGLYSCRIHHSQTQENLNGSEIEHGHDFYVVANKDRLYEHEITSILIGLIAAACGAVIGIIAGFIKTYLVYTCAPCRSARENAQATSAQLCQYLAEFEQNRLQNLRRIRENYAAQKQRIMQSYQQQVFRISDNYQTKRERFRDYRDETITSMRDQYGQQMTRIRGYSGNQLARIHRNYSSQLTRMRHFSYQQLDRARLQYKLKQKHVRKIFEQLPWPEGCRTMSITGGMTSAQGEQQNSDNGPTVDANTSNGKVTYRLKSGKNKKGQRELDFLTHSGATSGERHQQFWLPVDFDADTEFNIDDLLNYSEFDSLAPPSSLELSNVQKNLSDNHDDDKNEIRTTTAGNRNVPCSSFGAARRDLPNFNQKRPNARKNFMPLAIAHANRRFVHAPSRSRSRTSRPLTFCVGNMPKIDAEFPPLSRRLRALPRQKPVPFLGNGVAAARQPLLQKTTVVDIETNKTFRNDLSKSCVSISECPPTPIGDYMTPTSSLADLSALQADAVRLGLRRPASAVEF